MISAAAGERTPLRSRSNTLTVCPMPARTSTMPRVRRPRSTSRWPVCATTSPSTVAAMRTCNTAVKATARRSHSGRMPSPTRRASWRCFALAGAS
uniref:Secreted protein n=1 Tax=Steinernema glaseri TaxID=37863 RepID=A0A1I8A916_9BILA